MKRHRGRAVQFDSVGFGKAQEAAGAESRLTEAPLAADPTAETIAQPDHTSDAEDLETSADADGNEPESHPSPASVNESEGHPSSAIGNEPDDITKLTVKQLQALARQRGIGIARTKADFLKIIAAKHPDEDLQRLKGKALFDRVGELHISRLRSKDDLLRLLQAS